MQYEKIKYNKLGNGKNVVFFLHGYGGNKNSLQKLTTALTKSCTCYMFDLYGFGETKFPSKIYDIYDYAISLYLFCVKHDLHEINIVGHSFGGRIAIILASVFEINVKSLILIDAAGLKPKYNIKYYYNIWKYKLAKKLNKQISKYGSAEYRSLSGAMQKSYVRVVNQHLDYLINNITSQTLILWGSNDKDTPMFMCEKLSMCIKNSVCKIYNGDHFMYVKWSAYIKKDIAQFINDGEKVCT